MTTYTEREADIINPQTQMHYAILSSFEHTQFPHQHDCFEFFLLVKGAQELIVNEQTFLIEAGTLVLLRPGDVHSRRYIQSGYHINVAFSLQIANTMFDYLGEGYPCKELLSPIKPPCITLSENEKTSVRRQLNRLNAIDLQDTRRLRTELRILIMDMFVHYFSRCAWQQDDSASNWFQQLLVQMEQPENLCRGLQALLALSGKSHEHLCRVFRERLRCTPSSYVNELRLNYAANSLIHSNRDITGICLDAGYESISHFHHLFKKKYGMSPLKFRHANQNLLVL